MKNVLKFIGKVTLFPLFALWVALEDWFWEVLETWTKWWASLGVAPIIEGWIKRCSPRVSLALFVIPVVGMLPFKVGGLWLISHGYEVVGLLVFVLAKVTGTAIGARLFVLVKPALMTMPWFVVWWTRFVVWKTKWIDAAKATRFYRAARAVKRATARSLKVLKRKVFQKFGSTQ
jgi:hypothetical protein